MTDDTMLTLTHATERDNQRVPPLARRNMWVYPQVTLSELHSRM